MGQRLALAVGVKVDRRGKAGAGRQVFYGIQVRKGNGLEWAGRVEMERSRLL